MIELVRPTVDLADSWWEMVDDFAGGTIHGSSYRSGDREVLRDPAVFEEWVDWLGRMERTDEALPEGRVPSSNRWIVRDGRVVGTIAVRHALTPSLLVEGGHIGYAVAPGARRQGVARAALGLALRLAAARGIDPVLVTCDVANTASARTIISCGGILEDERDGVLRHWVRTGAPARAIDSGPIEARDARLVPITAEEASAMRAGERLTRSGCCPRGRTPGPLVTSSGGPTGSPSARSAASDRPRTGSSRSATASCRRRAAAV